MMDTEKRISQEGKVTCPICGYQFNWEYELTLIHNTPIEKEYGTKPSQIKMQPDKRIFFNIVDNSKIEFTIACPKCTYTQKTEKMSMLK